MLTGSRTHASLVGPAGAAERDGHR